MNTNQNEGGAGATRFGYFGDEPTEGGVRSVDPRPENGAAASERAEKEKKAGHVGGASGLGAPRGSSTGGRPGEPGPQERLLDITELVNNVGMRYRHRFELPPYQEGDLDVAEPAVGELVLTNTGAVLLARGHVKAGLRLECVRCLATTVQPVEADLEEEFPLVGENTAFHHEMVRAVDEDTGAPIIEGQVFNLGELLRQNLLLAAPYNPACSEECPGPDLGGREGEVFIPADAAAAAPAVPETDEPEVQETRQPFANLAALLEAKRRAEGQGGGENGA